MPAPAPQKDAPVSITLRLPDEAATSALGRELALFAAPGTWILLSGGLGAGKSTLARAFIRALAPHMGEFEAPSPTFTLVQPYDFTRVPVAHADLYRLGDPFEAEELGLDELARDHVLLVEWPDRLPRTPPDRLEIALDFDETGGRAATLAGCGAWAHTLRRFSAIRAFLDKHFADAPIERAFLQGDASARRYEYVTAPGGERAILMDMPARPDGPPVYDGRSYDEIANLSHDIRAVEAINSVLRERGYSAPRTLAHDFPAGLMLIEDLGEAVFGKLYRRGEMRRPLELAVDVLADMAGREWPGEVSLPGGDVHIVRPYDDAAFGIEVRLLTEWLWPRLKGAPAPRGVVEEYAAIWSGLFPLARAGRPVWVLRDYHSPNLLLLKERQGLARLGIIDTQDTVMGPAAYDLASLLQDARIEIPHDLQKEMLARYCAARAAASPDFDAAAFRRAYVVMGAQRACKVLGIFARLNDRDGKPAYLAHMPHVSGYLAENLAHRDLKPLAEWFARHLPEALDRQRLRREAS